MACAGCYDSRITEILKICLVPVQVLGQHINDFTLPDVNLIGEHSDAAELGRMLQLILGCAVNCEQKQGARPTLCLGAC